MTTTFAGYPRADGRVGIRNLVLVLPVSEALNRGAELVEHEVPDAVCITHFNAAPHGVAAFHRRVLTGLACNPNVGAVVLLGIDEDDTADLAAAVAAAGQSVEAVTLNGTGSMAALVASSVARARSLLAELATVPRVAAPLSRLLIGTECGGSDAYSGITANPALGHAVDRLVAAGASALLCELPELIGAEHLLADRAVDDEVRDQVLAAVRAWETLVVSLGEDLRNAQPTPGNQAGGITTVEEKSLGGVAKGGHSPVVEVVGYGVPPRRAGLVLMDTPGHDIEQLTAMAAAGAQVVVFTTGRGTPTASPIAPTIKVSTNIGLARRLADHIDVDAGPIAEGDASIADIGERILERIVAVASGDTTAAERYRQRDFALPRTAPSWPVAP